ncbi:hypothetical protein C8R45DRAFT_1091013 [Mycena sanguinolenta]|nr:hypothetical protein C8R45DRAFT_1091013 [Mycena sanguinolenta]
MADTKEIPEFYEKNALRFDDSTPEELPQFLENIERMMNVVGTAAADKNAFGVRYTTYKTREPWKEFAAYSSAYEDFKQEILANYSSTIDSDHGSTRKLRMVLKKLEEEDIGPADQDELMRLCREMSLEANKLMKSNQLTEREAVPLFFEKPEQKFREHILDNLEKKPPVMDEAKKIVQRQTVRAEFLEFEKDFALTASRHLTPGGRSTASEVIKREAIEASTALESIKSTMFDMMKEFENNALKKISALENSTWQQITTLYGSFPGSLSGTFGSRVSTTRRVYVELLTQTDLCDYCCDTEH